MNPADFSFSHEPDLIRLFIAPLEEAGKTGYMVSGSVASIEYGEPRATLDINVVLLLDSATCRTLARIFPPRGIPAISGPELDMPFLNSAIPSLGISESWKLCQSEF